MKSRAMGSAKHQEKGLAAWDPAQWESGEINAPTQLKWSLTPCPIQGFKNLEQWVSIITGEKKQQADVAAASSEENTVKYY